MNGNIKSDKENSRLNFTNTRQRKNITRGAQFNREIQRANNARLDCL